MAVFGVAVVVEVGVEGLMAVEVAATVAVVAEGVVAFVVVVVLEVR